MFDQASFRRFLLGLGITVGLMFVGLAVLLAVLLRQAREAETTAKLQADSVTAITFQLEREYLRFRESLALALSGTSLGDWDTVALRLDILYSRIDLLGGNKSVAVLEGLPEYGKVFPALEELLDRYEAPLQDPTAHRAELKQLMQDLGDIGPDVQSLSFIANSLVSQQLQTQFETLDQQLNYIKVLIGLQAFLLLAAGALVAMRQYQQMRSQAELQRLNLQLEQAREEADLANEGKSRFLANMSHELRTPFNGLMGMLDLLKETRLDERQRDFLGTASTSATHLLVLLNDILDMSSIEAGKIKIKPDRVDLHCLLRDVCSTMREQASAKGLAFDVEVAADVPPLLWIDPTRLRQILYNLLNNAVKFTEAGRVGLRLTASADGDELQIAVSDTGIGMSPEAQVQLFQRFYQVDSSASRRFSGTGLGLHISYALAQIMGGDLVVHSEEGKGSTFTVRLPVLVPAGAPEIQQEPLEEPRQETRQERVSSAPPAADAATPPATPPATPSVIAPDTTPTTPTAPRRLRVLVADDNAINQKLAVLLLEKMGHDPVVVTNGAEALAQVQAECFDLVLMDMHMPVMDGTDSARQIRALREPCSQVPIIALTANAMAEARQEALGAGMDDFLVKPVRFDDLKAAVERYGNRPQPGSKG